MEKNQEFKIYVDDIERRFLEMVEWSQKMGLIDILKLHAIQLTGNDNIDKLSKHEKELIFEFMRPALTWAMQQKRRHH